jgi:cytochrome c oxidase subunit 1
MLKAGKFSFKPYDLLLITSVLLLITSFFPLQSTLDLHLHDTYFVIAVSHITWVLSLFLFLMWGIYRLLSEVLFSRVMTWLHVLLTVIPLVIIMIIIIRQSLSIPAGMPRRYVDYNWSAFESFQRYNTFISVIAMVCILCQPVIILNVALGVIVWLRKKPYS